MKILVLPRASGNPYQRLLYTNKAISQVQVTYFGPPTGYAALLAAPLVLLRLAGARLTGTRIVHIHWLYFLELPDYGALLRWLTFVQTMCVLKAMRLMGMRIVWTAHNVLPHESQGNYGVRTTRYLTHIAASIIAHSPQTSRELAGMGITAAKKITLIPHGNYDGVYAANFTRTQMRANLGIQPNDTAILFFGLIRAYKGVEELLQAFEQLQRPGVRLIIAGECQDSGLAKTIAKAARKNKHISFINKSIPEKNVADYFAAADISCMPFKSITTSGSAILAATFGKPIVAPRLGALKDIPSEVGILYEPTEPQALLHALEKILSNKQRRAAMGRASRAYADTLSWDSIAAKTYKVYERSLARKPRT
ncbi:MAG TPA: glycosyltransferase family 4 protein [Candidatus Saccharimonadales bacterium]|nr:glycosyltransferase family 4 protein [Candidatus Saccharimonadales bacterium]